jgi:hypothetical protein
MRLIIFITSNKFNYIFTKLNIYNQRMKQAILKEEKYALKKLTQFASSKMMKPQNTIGQNDVNHKINVFTEFGKAKALILGYVSDTACIPHDRSLFDDIPYIKTGPFPQDAIKLAKKTQEIVADKLTSHGIHVVRPNELDHNVTKVYDEKTVYGISNYNPRDFIMYYHDTAYEAPTKFKERVLEVEALYGVLEKQMNLGGQWYQSWKTIENENDPFWDSANFLRLGLDLLYLISFSASEEGYWINRRFLEERYGGKVRLHPVKDVYPGVHIDTTFSALGYNKFVGKYLVLVNPKYVTPTNMPALFRGKNWMVIESPEMFDKTIYSEYAFASNDIGQNIFMLDPHLALVDQYQEKLIKILNHYGVECLTIPCEVGRLFDGGMHCITNDYNREEDMDFNKILTSTNNSKEELAGYFDPALLSFLQTKGDITEWKDIANNNGIFPNYLTDHLSAKEKSELKENHAKSFSHLL